MNPDRLLAQFDRLAEAPDAIPRLRRFILDLAVRGKLVEQDPNDEPAAELLKRIAAEKKRLGIKHAISSFKQGEIPFEIPLGWAWIRLGEMCLKTGSGSTPRGGKEVYKAEGVLFLRSQNIYDDGLRLNDAAYVDPETHNKMLGTKVLPSDLLLNITGGSIGRCCRVPDEFCEANVSQHVAIVRTALKGSEDFLHRLVLSSYFQSFIFDEQTGAGRGGLPKKRMDQIPVALPPLAEQHRIVAKVDELMALCDQLEAAQAEREQGRERLLSASLQRLNQPAEEAETFRQHARFVLDHLPRLTVRSEQIKSLRQTILNLAVRGRLVPQDPNDEPADVLIKRLTLEKRDLIKHDHLRRQNLLPPLSDNDMQFHVPDGWKWVRLGNLSQFVTSGSRDWASFYSDDRALFIRMGNLSKNHYQLRRDHIQRVRPPINSEGARTKLEAGDLLVSITGDVGLLGLIPEDFGEAYFNQHVAVIRLMPEMKSRYLAELFRSPFAQAQFNEPQRGIKNSFRLSDITQFRVPLPPLAEQHRIVAKVDELMAICDQLEAHLSTTHTDTRRLLEAVLHDALAPALADAA